MSYLGECNDEGCESNEAMWLTWVATYRHKIGLEERLQRNLLCTKNKRILVKCKVHERSISLHNIVWNQSW
jgi:hypothetical protein